MSAPPPILLAGFPAASWAVMGDHRNWDSSGRSYPGMVKVWKPEQLITSGPWETMTDGNHGFTFITEES